MEKLNLLKKQNALVQEVPATRSKKKKKKRYTSYYTGIWNI